MGSGIPPMPGPSLEGTNIPPLSLGSGELHPQVEARQGSGFHMILTCLDLSMGMGPKDGVTGLGQE